MKDAWKQYYDLIDKYTLEQEPRPDLLVVARAHERKVELSIGMLRDPNGKFLDKYNWTTTQRNVNTMRELAQTILDACDFVDAQNPIWAKRR